MKYSDGQKEAAARYSRKACDRISMIVKKGSAMRSGASPSARDKV